MLNNLQLAGVNALVGIEQLGEGNFISFSELADKSMIYRKNINDLYKLQAGTEGLISIIKRIIAGIVNTIFHIVNTFKTNILKFYRDLKRTELRYYHESNTVSVRRIFGMQFADLVDLKVPVPAGLNSTYPEVTKAIDDCLFAMNMTDRVESMKNYVKTIHDQVITYQEIDEPNIVQENFFDIDGITKKFNTMKSHFTNKKNIYNTPFISVFPDPNAFKETDEKLMNMEKYQLSVSHVFHSLESIEQYMNNLLKHFSDKPDANISKSDLQSLSVIATSLAKLFDMYGTSVQDQHRVEHNFVESLKIIRSAYNL